MLIGIDGNEANTQKRVGVNVYTYELLKNLHKLNSNHTFIIYLRGKPLPHMPPENKNWQYKILPGRGLWIITRLMPHLFLTKNKPDIFFTPSHYLPPLAPMPKICSILDLGFLNFSGQFKRRDYWQLKYWTAYSINISKRIISISKSTKADILHHYSSAKNKVDVTHLAYDKSKFHQQIPSSQIKKVKSKYKINSQNYILFISTLKPSKNIEGLINAWSKIQKDFSNTKLVIAGKKGWLFETIFQEVKELKLKERVVFTDFIDEKDKPALISGARLLTLPSFWEGFGLDVLNAMAVGTPVLTSNRGSLPEVAGKAGLVVDPDNINEIASQIKKVLTMTNLEYNKLVKAGLKQAEKFTWQVTAQQTLKILENAKG